jgi:hypothetical protein
LRPSDEAKYHKAENDAPDFRPPNCEIPLGQAAGPVSVPDPLPLIDGLLAASAKVRGLTLVTRNVAEVAWTGVALLDPFSA